MAISTAIDASAIARTIGVKTDYQNFNVGAANLLPQRVMLVGQGNTASTYSTNKVRVTSAAEVGQTFGYGSPLHLATLQLLPSNNDGIRSIPLTIYPLEDDASGTASTGSITITGTVVSQRNIQFKINGIYTPAITLTVGMDATQAATAISSAINATLDAPNTATSSAGVVTTTSKWKGSSANAIKISMVGPVDSGLTIAITQHTSGATNPSVQTALGQVGGVWETMVVNCLDLQDSTALDAYSTFGDGRWDAQVRKPLIVFTGHALTNPNDVVAITDARAQDRTNVAVPNPGSSNLPFENAAAAVARIALVANNNPARDYGRQPMSYVEAGLDSQQWNYAQRDQVVKGGGSTIEVRDGVVNVSDMVTMYHPTGQATPGYRYVKDIVKLQNVIFNVDLIFNTEEWDGAPLLPDNQPTTNRSAKRPKDAKAALATLAINLGREAIISDVPFTLENLQSEISTTNPNRLDTVFPVKVSGNTNIHSIDLNFGFYLGTATLI